MKRNWKWFTKAEVSAWPEGQKECRSCQTVKPFDCFHKGNSGQLFGLASDCKECRTVTSKDAWSVNRLRIKSNILQRAKTRAKKSNIVFDLDEDDIFIPDLCPVFKVPFILGHVDWSYSLDKIRPELGYTKGNVIVVSRKANTIKNNATPDDILAVGNFYKALHSRCS